MSRWSNEDAAPGEDEEEIEGEWELDPNDPSHPDYDLSESAGYGGWEPSPKPVFLWRGVILLLTLLVLAGLLIPFVLRVVW